MAVRPDGSTPELTHMKFTISIKSLGIIVCLSMFLVGCASAGRNYDSRKVSQIEKGKTTEAELIQMFGLPTQRGVNSEDQTTMQWVYSEATTKGATFVPIVGLFAGGVDTKTKILNVNLTNNVVTSYTYSGGGLDVISHTKSDPETAGSATTTKPTTRR